MAEIYLCGYKVLLDDEDVEKVKKYKWHLRDRNIDIIYFVTNLYKEKRKLYLHRYITNARNGFCIDHMNHDFLDNRKCNLRECTQKDNNRNMIIRRNNTSGYQGVCWDKSKNKWMAKIKINHKDIFLGRYDNKELAYRVYNDRAKKNMENFIKKVRL